ncbi:hypothetical protein [Micromonospora sp. CPCC 206061]|uniref:hypothetical protein n=1 Tax=Micromonospora sp. CPCC 206061 TaxID=3122410 RepID=UPI002FF31771
MNRSVALALAVVGAVGAVAAIFLLPWAHYGQFEVALLRFPLWGLYVAAAAALNMAAALNATVGHMLLNSGARRWLRISGVGLGAVAAGAAVLVMTYYQDGTTLIGPAVPLVFPTLGLGGPVALIAALCSTAATIAAPRRSTRAPAVAPGRARRTVHEALEQ